MHLQGGHQSLQLCTLILCEGLESTGTPALGGSLFLIVFPKIIPHSGGLVFPRFHPRLSRINVIPDIVIKAIDQVHGITRNLFLTFTASIYRL